MNTQEILEGVVKLAPIINEGKKAFTESRELKDQIISWYGNHGTKLSSEEDSKGFWIWNAEKI